MKKSLLAVAAMTAFAGAAQAQSSVTVYGIMDAGLSASNRYIAGTSTQTQSTAAGGQESSSRIGFKGSEDLGGGQSAFFTAEFGVNVAKNNFSGSTNSYNNASFDNRQSFVGIKDNKLGAVSFGRQYSVTHVAISNTDAMGGNNLIGGTTYVGGNSTSDFASTPSYGNSAYILRLSESVQYESPKFMGANVLLQASTNKKNSNTTQTNTNDTTSAALDWTFQSARLIASRSINKVNTTITAASDQGLAQSLYVGANNLKQTETAVGGTYDFGVAKVYANYLSTILEGTIGTSTLGTQGKRTAQEVGFNVPYGKFLIKAKYGSGSSNMSAATTLSTSSITSSSYNFRGYQAGADYLMSKRTNLYALYGRASGDLSATTNYAANQVAIGVRHTF